MLGCNFWIRTQWDAGAPRPDPALHLLRALLGHPGARQGQHHAQGDHCCLKDLCLLRGQVRSDDPARRLLALLRLLFPALITMPGCSKQQQPRQAVLWGQLIVLFGSFLAITNPAELRLPGGTSAAAWGGRWGDERSSGVPAAAAELGSAQEPPPYPLPCAATSWISWRRPRQSESQFESLIYYCINQLSQSQDQTARLWVLRWGVVLLSAAAISSGSSGSGAAGIRPSIWCGTAVCAA